MNNLFIIAIAGTIGLALVSTSQRSIAETESELVILRARSSAAAADANCSQTEMRRLERLFVTKKESLQKLRAEINIRAVAESTEPDLSELNPQKEGFWPADKPYFYLSKTRLQGLYYFPFTDTDELSKTAVTLFGMTPEEERAANAVYADLREKIRQFELAHATPTNASTWIESWPGTKKSLYIEAMPREAIAALTQEFKSNLMQAIGAERGSILARRMDEDTDQNGWGLMRARTYTLIRDGERIQLSESYGEGNTMTSSSQNDDGKYEIPRHVRHLFSGE
jgi:hypothetical protein